MSSKYLSPYKKYPCTDKEILRCEQLQADFVDREIFVQQLLLAYIRDIRNLEVFIAPDVRQKLGYSTEPNLLWDFCSFMAETAKDGISKGNKKGRQYLGYSHNGMFIGVCFAPKDMKVSLESLISWAENINFTEI